VQPLKIWLASLTVLLSLSILGLNFDEAFAGATSEVTLTKTPSKLFIAAPGENITYDYKILNSGANLLVCDTLTDDTIVGDLLGGSVILLPGEMVTRTSPTVFISGTTTNNALVTCRDDASPPNVTGTDSATVTVLVLGSPTIDKSVLKETVVANQANQVTIVVGGGPLAYEDCVVTDPKVGFTSNSFNLAANTPAQQTFGPLAYSIPATDTNTATVNCTEPVTMQPVSNSDSQLVTVVALGGLEIMKNVDKTTVNANDNMVTYNYKVTNSIGFDVIMCQITDSILGAVGAQFSLANGAMTDPLIFSNIVVITQTTMNTATVTCFEPVTMNPVMSPISNEVRVVFEEDPMVSLIKLANPTRIEAGQTVTYTYDSTNPSLIALFDCNITDDKIPGPIGPADFTLLPGESKTFQTSTIILENTKNTGTVTCNTGVTPPTVSSSNMADVKIIIVGGEFLPIDTTALFVSGFQTSLVWILPVVAGLAGTGYYLIRFRNKE